MKYYSILLILLIFSCKKENNNDFDISNPIAINIDNFTPKTNKTILNKITDFSFISLTKIPELSSIGKIKKVINHKNKFFVFDDKKSNILVFNANGVYLNSIGDRGAGPEEYKRINDFDINKKEGVIYILNNPFLLTYNMEGNFLNKKLLEFYPVKMATMTNGNIAFNLPTIDDDFCHLIIADKHGDFLSKTGCYPAFSGFVGNSRTGGVNSINDPTYYNYTGSSVIYKVTDEFKLKPIFEFDLGSYMWLEEDKNDVGGFRKKFKNNSVSFLYNSYCITNKWLLFEYKISSQENTSFAYFNIEKNELSTKKSFDEYQLLDLFGVPVGLDVKNRFITNIDYEVYNEISEINNTKELLKNYDLNFYNALNNLNQENTNILMLYSLKN